MSINHESEILSFSKQISVLNTKEILAYGSNPQSKTNAFINQQLPSIPSHTNAEIRTDIQTLINELDVTIKACKQRTWSENANTILSKTTRVMSETARRLELHISSLTYHMNRIESSYEDCMRIIQEFDMYIQAGELCLSRTLDEDIPTQTETFKASGSKSDELLLQDYEYGYQLLRKKIDSLMVSREIPYQTAIHIRTIQHTEQTMVESIRTLITGAFPTWKSAIAFSKGIAGQMSEPVAENVSDACRVLRDTLQSVLNVYQSIDKK